MAKGVIGLRRELPIVHERRRNFPFCWAKRERHCLHLPRTRRRNGTATSCVTMTFREVLLMVLDGKNLEVVNDVQKHSRIALTIS